MGNSHTDPAVDDIDESHKKLIEDILNEMDMSIEDDSGESQGHDHGNDLVASDAPNNLTKPFTTRKVPHLFALYQNIEKLGVGGTCSVKKMRERLTGQFYAVKTMPISQWNNERLFQNEVEMLSALEHPLIIKYHDHFRDEKRMCIATEYCPGLTLSHRLIDRVRHNDLFSEQEAANYVRQILSVAAYLHSKQIVHRDFKCNNVVFAENGDLKVIDFGFAQRVDPMYVCCDFVGTLYCAAPESAYCRNGEALKKSDVWAIGVICFMLVTGRPPFNGPTQSEMVEQIMNYRDVLRFPDGVNISEQCKDFLHCLLRCDVGSRLSAEEALCHQWIAKGGAATLEDDDDSAKYSNLRICPPTEDSADDSSVTMSYTVNGTPSGSVSPPSGDSNDRSDRSDFDFSILDDMDIDTFLDSFLEHELRTQPLQSE